MTLDLTLPSSIPGLLRRGSPVFSPATGARGVVDRVPGDKQEDSPLLVVVSWDRHTPSICEGFCLDIDDVTGRFHAALWLRERGHELRWAEGWPEVLAWSVLSVHRGGAPLVILARWVDGRPTIEGNSFRCCTATAAVPAWVNSKGWKLRDGKAVLASGPETGAAGKAAADAAALRLGFALLGDDALTLPPLPPETP